MALDGELRVLLAVKDHLDGLADLVLRHQQSAAEHVGEMLLAAERAAGRALANDDIVVGNVQQPRDGLADVERALGGGIEDELAVLHIRDGEHGRNLFVAVQCQHIHDGHALGVAPRLRDLVTLFDIHLAPRREEEDIVVRRGSEYLLDRVLLLGC